MNYKSFESYLRKETRALLVTRKEGYISKFDLTKWAVELNLNVNGESRLAIFKELISSGVKYIDFYNRFKYKAYGIPNYIVCGKLRINNNKLMKLVREDRIKIMYSRKEEFEGIEKNVYFIDAEKYYELLNND